MQISPTITITGIDERSSIPLMVDLLQRHPALEIGLLLTLSPEGRHRYPGRAWLAAAAAALSGRCALHVCGAGARAALAEGGLQDLTAHAARIQVNGTLDVEAVEALAEGYPSHTLITQFNGANADHLQVRARNHALLIDASGGRGVAPGTWARPLTSKAVGFAGGLGPLTLAHELPRIHAVASDPWWIDMETSVRDATDWFDAQRAHKAIRAFEAWLAATTGARAQATTAAGC